MNDVLEGGLTRISGGIASASLMRVAPSGMAVAVKNALAANGFSEEDLLYMSTPLIHEGINLNGQEFTREEMKANYKSMIGTPLDLDHSDSVAAVVGKNYDADYQEVDDKGIITVHSYIYAKYFGGIAAGVLDGSINGMSMEVRYKSALRRVTPTRTILTLQGCQFIGAGLVRFPGEQKAIIDNVRTSASLDTDLSEEELTLLLATAALLQERRRIK